MKILLLFTSLLFSINLFGQYGHKESIKEKYIDLKTTYIYFEIKNMIEVNGHTFKNDTCQNPFIYKADINGISIYRKYSPYVKYKSRNCGDEKCKIIHLEKIEENIFNLNEYWRNNLNPSDIWISDTIKFFGL